jgi:predicted dienelactone hydrolase
MSETRLARRIVIACAGLGTVAILGVAALLASLWVEHGIETTLPTPTGSLAVGRAIYDWTDPARLDSLAPLAGTKRELLVWIWYPAAAVQGAAPIDDYLPVEMRAVAAPGGLMRLVTRDLAKAHGHSTRDADLSPHERSYPVVIMRGGASSPVWNYSTLAEDLASHGYVVVGFDAPYRTGAVAFPDGRVMRRTPENDPELALGSPDSARRINKLLAAWTDDIAFVLDRLGRLRPSDSAGRFAGRLDLTRVGVFGHSFGGATTAEFCRADPRCHAGIDVDGAPLGSVIQTGLRQPFMFLLSDHGDTSESEGRQIWANIQSIYDRLPPDRRQRIAIRGANHFLFSDDGALLKSHIVLRGLRMLGIVGIDGRRQLAVTTYCVRTFFDAYLKGAGASRLEMPASLYPEIQVLE